MVFGVNFVEGVEAFTAALFRDVLGWSQDEVSVLNANVRSAVRKGDALAMCDFHVIIGQKPPVQPKRGRGRIPTGATDLLSC
jgi:hypothetical protein